MSLGLQICQLGWPIHWCMVDVSPIELAYTSDLRLQNHQLDWPIHQCMANVQLTQLVHTLVYSQCTTNPVGPYIRHRVTQLPIGLVHTSDLGVLNCQPSWRIHGTWDYKTANWVGSYIGVQPMHYQSGWPIHQI